jgi:hypothetical protein
MKRLFFWVILLSLVSCGRSAAQEHAGKRDASVKIVDTLSRKDRDALYRKIREVAALRDAGNGQNEHEAIYPWVDCASHLEKLVSYDVLVTDMRCHKCGRRIVIIPFRSPAWTWEHMCGREGELYLCPSCMRQVRFDCWVMN